MVPVIVGKESTSQNLSCKKKKKIQRQQKSPRLCEQRDAQKHEVSSLVDHSTYYHPTMHWPDPTSYKSFHFPSNTNQFQNILAKNKRFLNLYICTHTHTLKKPTYLSICKNGAVETCHTIFNKRRSNKLENVNLQHKELNVQSRNYGYSFLKVFKSNKLLPVTPLYRRLSRT